jgi:2'-deoxynucleoside 5'-phosphate N-hydrolase
MPTAYISGPLHSVSDLARMRRFYEFLAEVCRECGFDPYLPHAHTDPELNPDLPSIDVFRKDLQHLTTANIVVAYIGMPSSGVGAELGISLSRDAYVVAIFRRGDSPSRFLLGMVEDSPHAVVLEFTDESHCRELLRRHLSLVVTNCCA